MTRARGVYLVRGRAPVYTGTGPLLPAHRHQYVTVTNCSAAQDYSDAGGRALVQLVPPALGARAAMRVRRPEVAAIRALQVHQGALVAQEVLPVCIAVATTSAHTTFGAVIAARTGQPCAAATVGGRINR